MMILELKNRHSRVSIMRPESIIKRTRKYCLIRINFKGSVIIYPAIIFQHQFHLLYLKFAESHISRVDCRPVVYAEIKRTPVKGLYRTSICIICYYLRFFLSPLHTTLTLHELRWFESRPGKQEQGLPIVKLRKTMRMKNRRVFKQMWDNL